MTSAAGRAAVTDRRRPSIKLCGVTLNGLFHRPPLFCGSLSTECVLNKARLFINTVHPELFNKVHLNSPLLSAFQ